MKNQITDVCRATDMSDEIEYYLNRPRILHDQHGIGPFLFADAEFLKAGDSSEKLSVEQSVNMGGLTNKVRKPKRKERVGRNEGKITNDRYVY